MITRSWKHCLLGGIFLIGTVGLRAQEPAAGAAAGTGCNVDGRSGQEVRSAGAWKFWASAKCTREKW